MVGQAVSELRWDKQWAEFWQGEQHAKDRTSGGTRKCVASRAWYWYGNMRGRQVNRGRKVTADLVVG